jgi:predicted DNA-binding ArsR family transcriptional regulator
MFAVIIEWIWNAWGSLAMWLTRREILEQLGRLGIRTIRDLKKACREFEAYWNYQRQRV